jgi:ParB family transcriptional regulator, chromosome partitioning protein
MTKRALGKGLGALLGGNPAVSLDPALRRASDSAGSTESAQPLLGGRAAVMVAVGELVPNPNQPRKHMDDNALRGLAQSIEQNGVLQPVLVRKKGKAYELVAGERRLRAAQLAGLEEIPALVCTMEEAESMKVALLENIQREDLNAIEEAEALHKIMEHYGATHQELAAMLGKSRSSVSNALRLLGLEHSIQEKVVSGELSMGHARALLSVDDPKQRLRLARETERKGLSVRALEEKVRVLSTKSERKGRSVVTQPEAVDPEAVAIREFETRLQHHLGSPCRIRRRGKRGKVEIEFFSNEELERVLESMGISSQL